MRSSIVAFTVLNLGIHLNAGVVFQSEVLHKLTVAIYTAPWVRIVPYIMGTITAVNIYEGLKTKKVSDQHEFCLFIKRILFPGFTLAHVAFVLGSVRAHFLDIFNFQRLWSSLFDRGLMFDDLFSH
jgi:hypothetical protein